MLINAIPTVDNGSGGINLTDPDPARRRARLLAAKSAEELASLYALPTRAVQPAGRPGGLTRDLAGNVLSKSEMSARFAWAKWSEAHRAGTAARMESMVQNGEVTGSWNDITMPAPRDDRAPTFSRTPVDIGGGRVRVQIGPNSSIEAPAGSFRAGRQRRPAAPTPPTARPMSAAERSRRSDQAKAAREARSADTAAWLRRASFEGGAFTL